MQIKDITIKTLKRYFNQRFLPGIFQNLNFWFFFHFLGNAGILINYKYILKMDYIVIRTFATVSRIYFLICRKPCSNRQHDYNTAQLSQQSCWYIVVETCTSTFLLLLHTTLALGGIQQIFKASFNHIEN